MVTHLDVCIRGGGVVGRTLALLLARERLRVGLVEQATTPGAADVRAYALNRASRDLLESVRGWPEGEGTPELPGCICGDGTDGVGPTA